ncbi:acetate--CoA ligase alpha subunit [Desulfovibrio subterraneus]|uniref:Acyl-CoA synthetase n=1 Tax=Desulfovibrio subterraneus TaxID=2718620 RepID=A0A7J0BJG4_9BACT|nr:acetate--CoA ligase [Desulfovibrio subterraneus]GFM33769.1 acyl-CoA synthetase [Desulfovibrio subterraneus]
MTYHRNIPALFNPENVAIIGASATTGKIGNVVLANLLEAGFAGGIYPVNPKSETILGCRVVRNIRDLPDSVDLAVICIPPAEVAGAVDELGKKGVKSIVVITAGFKEIGGNGWYLEENVKKLAEKYGIALLGPNCLGLINTGARLNTTFAVGQPARGNIAFFSQSGALCVSILDWAQERSLGFSKFISIGNKAILDESDILAYLAEDPDTRVIIGYVEGVECGQRFLQVAQNVTREKPVIMIKSGKTGAGAKAASSHTGAMAGADQAYEAAFVQTGIMRVSALRDLFNLAQAFSSLSLPAGPNVGVVTNSGGPGIMAADAIELSRLIMAPLSASTVDALKGILPPFAAFYNPVDVIGDAKADRFSGAIDIVLKDEMVHSLLILVSPTARTGVSDVARAIVEVVAKHNKPVFACLMGGPAVREGREILVRAGIPCYDFPEPAIQAIEALNRYREWKVQPMPVEVCYRRNITKAREIIRKAQADGTQEIVEFQAQGLLKAYELPIPDTRLCRTSDEAIAAAKQIGFPVVLKIASPQISHKSDVGGVKVNLKSPEEVQAAFLDITSRAQRQRKDAYIMGCLVQGMVARNAKEVLIGFKRDPQFGPMIIFGLGGIYVEVLRDISCRLAPLSLSDAHDMIREIKSFPLLQGVRGEESVNFTAIEDILLIMSQLSLDFPEIHEAEFNPVLVNSTGAWVADVRVILAPAPDAGTCGLKE